LICNDYAGTVTNEIAASARFRCAGSTVMVRPAQPTAVPKTKTGRERDPFSRRRRRRRIVPTTLVRRSGSRLGQQRLQLARLIHLANDVASADELAVDV